MLRAVKRICCVMVFIIVICTITYHINNVLKWKDGIAIERVYKFGKDTIDVASYGSSHDFCTFNPVMLWDRYGVAAACLSESGQTFEETLSYMKESAKYHSPKLMVVEGYYLTSIGGKPNATNGNLYRNTLNLKYSDIYIDNVEKSIDEESIKPANINDFRKWLLLKFPVYHSRYSELTKKDFEKFNISDNGFNTVWTTEEHDMPEACYLTKETELNDAQMSCVDEAVKIAKDNNAEILIYIAPYVLPESHMKLYNAYEKYCESKGIPFINFNKSDYIEKTGFDFSKDIRYENNAGIHLNYDGASKITEYLTEYISENYDLEDRKGNSKYSIYNTQSEHFKDTVNNHMLTECADLSEYLELIDENTSDYAIVCNKNSFEIANILAEKSYDIAEAVMQKEIYATADSVSEKVYILSDSVVVKMSDEPEGLNEIYLNKEYKDCSDADVIVLTINKKDGNLTDMSKFVFDGDSFNKISKED